jgi:hydrogenase/urease accessory protein HupE
VLGVEHILAGIDHLLFVLALLLIVRGSRRIVATITAFTIAHSLTLVAATLGWVHVPGPPVEAIIALSIVFVAAEVVHELRGKEGLTARAPWVVAFSFGLLHGLGFAGALAEVGLPQKAIPVALLTFNVGVELGQLLFVAVVLLLGAVFGRLMAAKPAWTTGAVAYGIGAVAAFWTLERVVSFGHERETRTSPGATPVGPSMICLIRSTPAPELSLVPPPAWPASPRRSDQAN